MAIAGVSMSENRGIEILYQNKLCNKNAIYLVYAEDDGKE
jgi:tetrahydromethanopterin S-methyltransferase subunit A